MIVGGSHDAASMRTLVVVAGDLGASATHRARHGSGAVVVIDDQVLFGEQPGLTIEGLELLS